MAAALAWGAVSSFCIAVGFSYRLVRGIAGYGTVVTDWKSWMADDYLRNDFWIVVLGWAGFLTTAAGLIARQAK